eukprot:6254389-Prymnesium_polylepis.1
MGWWGGGVVGGYVVCVWGQHARSIVPLFCCGAIRCPASCVGGAFRAQPQERAHGVILRKGGERYEVVRKRGGAESSH